MGNTVIITHENALNFYVAKKLTEKLSDTRIIFSPDTERKYLASQSQFGMMIEVGPVPNSVLNSVILEGTIAVLDQILQELSTLTNLTTGSVEIYEEIEDVFYPKTNGELSACIHPDFQGKDFVAIEGDYTPFKAFSGENLRMKTKEKLYPIFINEAAYYRTGLAFTLCRKKDMKF
jgi:aspartoacylase